MIFLVVGSLQSSLFAQLTVSGLANGGIYASLGVALVLIYRATQVINFAQGAIATFTTYVAWQLMTWGLSYWLAFFLTLGIAFVGGTLLELITIRPVERRGNVLTVVIATLGVLILRRRLRRLDLGRRDPLHAAGVPGAQRSTSAASRSR